MIDAARRTLGDRLMVLCHHHQRAAIARWADARGDVYRLSVLAAQRPEAEFVVVCGVRPMAEMVDVLTADHQRVVLPDLNAGCSLADMTSIDELEAGWASMAEVVDVDGLSPVVHMMATAAMKAFGGRHGGALCTAANAEAVATWALAGDHGGQVLFLPDQHLGRNTALGLGYGHQDMAVWNPHRPTGGCTVAEARSATFLLWKAHCSVHQRFHPDHVGAARAGHPDVVVVAHPTARYEVCDLADQVGSTDDIVRTVAAAPAGTAFALATEVHLVWALAADHPDKTIVSLDPVISPCPTMTRIDLPHLAWTLESLVDDEIPNEITVDPDTADQTKLALHRMLDIPHAVAAD